jgi:Ni,Fe-hydrogenase I large subunit
LQWAKTGRTSAARLLREVLERGWAEVGRSPIAVLPRLSARQLEECLGSEGADGFVAEPTWNGTPAETSPFSRNFAHPLVEGLTESFGNGLLPRLAAQLLELALLLRELAAAPEGVRHPEVVVASVLAPGVGLAQGQAARGLLVHRVAVAGERVMDYRILAPTEWNFHPRGVVAAGLAALPSTDVETLRRVASLFVTSVDPCVDYDVIIR